MLWNQLRLGFKKFGTKNLQFSRIEMLGFNTKMCFSPSSEVSLGDRLVSDGRLVMMVGNEAQLEIGSRVYFNENAMISCKKKISIGEGCKFGPNVVIIDNNHKFDVQIGENCVIGAGCIISGEVPGGTIVKQSRDLHMERIRE